jgi:DNA-binding transcriptional LysR family regulator
MNKLKHIPLYLIESFLAAVEGPSFQEAASRLEMTQSALSRQMQQLEEYLPHNVFTFEGRKKVLTKYGRTLYDLLVPQFSQTQGLINQASLLFAEPEKAQVKICGRGELLDMIASRLKFQGQVSFESMDSSQALEAVLNRQCDIGIVYSSVDSSELILKHFFSNRLRIVVPKALLKSKPSAKEDLATKLQKLPCLLYKTDDPVVDKFLQEYGLKIRDLKVSRVYSNYAALIKMINADQGWAVIPSNLEIPEENYHVFQLSGRSQDERKFYLCYRRELKDAVWFKDLLNEFTFLK